MHYIVLVQLLKSLQQLPEDNQSLLLTQHLLLLQQRLKSTPVAVLIDKIEVVGSFEGLYEPDYILIFEGRQNVDLVYG